MQNQVNEKLSVKPKTAAKLGLVTSIFVIMSSIMGVGIFFKNGSVFLHNNGNATGILVSWILTGIIAMFTAISFTEILTVKQKENFGKGLGGWASELNGYNFGRAIRIWMPTFYYALKLFACTIYTGTSIVYLGYCMNDPQPYWFGDAKNFTTLFIMIIGMVVVGIFITINYISERVGPAMTRVLTILKFVPVVFVLIICVVSAIRNDAGLWIGNTSYIAGLDQEKANQFDMLGVLNSIPGIMFTFDGFLAIGNISDRINKPEKNVSLAVVFGMIIVIALNLLVTISFITVGSANPFGIFTVAFETGLSPEDPAYQVAKTAGKWCSLIMTLLIIVSAIGGINAYSMIGSASCKEGIENESLMFGKQLKKIKNGDTRLAGALYFGAILLFYYIAFGVPSCILNTIQIFDGTGATIVLFFFAIYAIVLMGGFINRRTKNHEVQKSKAFNILAPIAIIGCAFVFLYSLIYTYTIKAFSGGLDANWQVWGLSFTPTDWNNTRDKGGTNLYVWEAMVVFWCTIAFFIAYPFINDAVLKATNKEYNSPLIWQKHKHFETIIEIKKTDSPKLA